MTLTQHQFDSFSGREAYPATLQAPFGAGPIHDHGFRVDSVDPLITHHGDPGQDYSADPANHVNNWVRPTSVNSAAFMKRELESLQYIFADNASPASTATESTPLKPGLLIMDATATTSVQSAHSGDNHTVDISEATAAGTATLLYGAKETGEQPQAAQDQQFTEPVPTFRPEADRETRKRFHEYYSVNKIEHEREVRNKRKHIHDFARGHGHDHERKIGD